MKEKKNNFVPQPYRITIKLSAANPSAPAEKVTKALRLAGVKFEVEMIQLIQDEPSSQQKSVGRTNRSRDLGPSGKGKRPELLVQLVVMKH